MDIKVDANTVVCFDLDDTLYNEIDYLKSAYRQIAMTLAKENWKILYGKMFSLYRSKKDVFTYLINVYPTTSKEILLNDYRNHVPSINLFPGVRSIFDKIKKQGGKLAIITDGRSETQRNKLHSLGIMPVLDKVVISGEIGTEKPNEANFKVIEAAFKNHTYYYIGDNFKKDFLAPNKRNWISMGLLDNGRNIHNNTFDYSETEGAPQKLIISYGELNIVPF